MMIGSYLNQPHQPDTPAASILSIERAGFLVSVWYGHIVKGSSNFLHHLQALFTSTYLTLPIPAPIVCHCRANSIMTGGLTIADL